MTNPYDDEARAEAYAELGARNTYYLAYRDLPELLVRLGASGPALDYGCGTGRSTRLLRDSGLATVGVDISTAMIREARDHDPDGDYQVIAPGRLDDFPGDHFGLALAVMPFESMATQTEKVSTLREIHRVLRRNGWLIVVATSRDVYLHEYASFSSEGFPENASAANGDTVRVVITDLNDNKTVEDTLWTEQSYLDSFASAGFDLSDTKHPVPSEGDEHTYPWVSESLFPPWHLFVLKPGSDDAA